MISIWLETDPTTSGLGSFFSNMSQNKDPESPTNWRNIALLIASAAALFHCISSLDENSLSFAGKTWQDYMVNLGVLCFAMLTLSLLVADQKTPTQQKSPVIYEHGEPKGYRVSKRRNSSISWADQK